jgi:hypothetical protein
MAWGGRKTSRALGVALGLTLAGGAGAAQAQAWFGQPLPGPLNDPAQPVVETLKTDLPGDVLRLGPGPKSPLLNGERIKQDVRTIVGFSLESRASGQFLWGRVSGTPAYMSTVEWAAAELRKAGLSDVRIETFTGPLTLPVSGEIRMLADQASGDGARDVVLQSAMVGGRGPVNGSAEAPLIYLGRATEADIAGRDVRGRVAVIHTKPDPSLYGADVGRQAALIKAGAAGVIEILEQPGNMQSYDGDRHGCGTGLCFTVGGEDGYFLQNVLAAAAKAGKTVNVRLNAVSRVTPDAPTGNVVAILPGKRADNVVVNAHADAWFTGADDNASGLATLMALARYFAHQPKLDRTLIFVVSAGHHNNLNGLANFREVHGKDILPRTDLMVNIEHTAVLSVDKSSGLHRPTAGQRPRNFGLDAVTSNRPIAKQVGVSNGAPFLVDLWSKGGTCFGLSLRRMVDDFNPGELSSFREAAPVRTQMIGSGPLYHTTGEAVDSLSVAELERAARFHAYFVREVAQAPRALLQAGAWTPRTTCPPVP